MSIYTTNDFSESLDCARRDGHDSGVGIGEISRCVAAWGEGDYGWDGGFLVQLADGRFAYISGWNDSTGWG